MRQVGRELEGEQRVVQIQVLANVVPQRRITGQLQQTTMVLRQAQLARRAQHAKAFHTTQLAHFDEERLAIVAGRQFGTHQRARHANAHTRIGRTTHDGEQRAIGLAHVHLAHTQTVCVGVLHSFFDFANDDFGERRRHGLQLFHLQACHRQGVGQLLRRERGIAEGAQPGFGKLHGENSVNGTLHHRGGAIKKRAFRAFLVKV